MRRIAVAERRARLGVRHRLAKARASTVVGATEAVVALHSTDPATVFLSLWARTKNVTPDGIDRALYVDRSLLRESKNVTGAPKSPEPLRFGVEACRPVLEIMIDYCHKQGLIPAPLSVDCLFDDVTRKLGA